MGGNVWKRMDLSRMEQLKLFTMFQQMKLAIMEKKKKKFASFFFPLEQGQTKEESPRVECITDFIFEALVLPEILNCNTCFFCALQVTNNCTGELWL